MTDPRPDESPGSRFDRSAYMRAYRARYKATRRRVAVVLGATDWRALEAAAKAEGRRPQAIARSAILDHLAKRRPLSHEAARRLDEANRLLANVANNVNQIAHRLNEGALINPGHAPDAREARALLGGIFEGLAMVRSQVASMAAASGAGESP